MPLASPPPVPAPSRFRPRPVADNLDADVPPDAFPSRPEEPIREAECPRLSYIAACDCGAWQLWVWPKDDPKQINKLPFRCRSWRHEGSCRLFKGAQDFVRCREAMESLDSWCHVTLTFEQPEGSDPLAMYVEGKNKWAKLRKRIGRKFGTIKYIQTWERHRSGYPHVHLALSCERLYDAAAGTPRNNWEKLLQAMAVECKFGPVGWCERLRSKAAFSGYLQKLARELTGRGKEYQIPVNAPKNFRRLRASVGLLPPVHKNPDISGVLKLCAK